MITAILLGLVTFLISNIFVEAGWAALIGVAVGLLVYFQNHPSRR